MDVQLAKENADGSAVFTFDMSPEETRMMVLYGIKCALEAAIKDARAWDGENDLQQDNAGLSD
jgi:hypothetical protein